MADDQGTDEKQPRKLATDAERVRLQVAAEAAIAALRNASGVDDRLRVEAVEIALYAVRALADLRYLNDETQTWEPITDPEVLHRVWNVLQGGRLTTKKDDKSIAYRRIAYVLQDAADGLVADSLVVQWARENLRQLDSALARATDEVLEVAIAKVRSGGSMTGAIRDLLLATGAVETKPTADVGGALQKSIDRALERLDPSA